MNLIKKMFVFFNISGIGWLIDVIIYSILVIVLNINIDLANIISSLIGVSFVFLISTKKLFLNSSKINLKIKYILYILYQILLIYLVSKTLLVIKDSLGFININFIKRNIELVSKIIITPFTMLINFFVVKKLIEKL